MTTFQGFLFSKLDLIGSKSEGPRYFLQMEDYSELDIKKRTDLSEEDPILQRHLGAKVVVEGELEASRLQYRQIRPVLSQEQLQVYLKLESTELSLNKEPPTPEECIPFLLALIVRWPHRSVWKGVCATSQLYDFFIEREGEVIWRWSQGVSFAKRMTPVEIIGGSYYKFAEIWPIDPATIEVEGIYKIRGVFLASNQEVERELEIKVMH